MLKDKKVLIGIVIAVIIVLGAAYMLFGKKSNSSLEPTPEAQDQTVQSLSPEDIGLKMEAGSDASCLVTKKNNQVKFIVEKASDIKNVVGDISYEADVPASEKVEGGNDRVVQSLEVEKEAKNGKIDSGFKLMGTCSKNVCRCDTGVKSIDLILKITKTDGKIYEAKDTLKL